MSQNCMRLCVPGFGLAFGVMWAIGILVAGWVCWWTGGWARAFVDVIASVYVGYQATFWGGIIGAIWALIDGFIGGVIMAWIYNCCCGKKAE